MGARRPLLYQVSKGLGFLDYVGGSGRVRVFGLVGKIDFESVGKSASSSRRTSGAETQERGGQ